MFDPEVIALQFTLHGTSFSTPALTAGRENFTSYAEAVGFLNALKQRHSRVEIETVGTSQHWLRLCSVTAQERPGGRQFFLATAGEWA